MPIITLTSDLGLKDYYVSSIKGAILSQLDQVHIVDISHDIKQFDITQAAFVIKNSFRDFPKGSIHILGVLPQLTSSINHVVVKYMDQYFIGADNGIFSLFLESSPQKVVQLELMSDSDSPTFPTRDIFVKAACHIARGGEMELLGKTVNTLNQSTSLRPHSDESVIRGSVIYVDSYGNVITNISKDLFKEVGKQRPFVIQVRQQAYQISVISKSYYSVPIAERLAIFGSSGLLEIAISLGNAANLMGLQVGSSVSVQFI